MSSPVPSPNRVRAQAVVLLLLAFLAGAFVGGTLERLSHGRRADRPSRGSYAGGMGRGGYGGRGGGFSAIYDSLNLSEAQRAAIDTIMIRQRPVADSLRKAITSSMDDSRKAVEAVLTPAQRAKADSMRARTDSLMRSRGGMRARSDSGRRRPNGQESRP